MATIVAFSVTSRGQEALERLAGVAQDAALVYKGDGGKVNVRRGVLRGALLGAAVSIFTGPLVGMAAAGGGAGAAYGALRDAGVSDNYDGERRHRRLGHCRA